MIGEKGVAEDVNKGKKTKYVNKQKDKIWIINGRRTWLIYRTQHSARHICIITLYIYI